MIRAVWTCMALFGAAALFAGCESAPSITSVRSAPVTHRSTSTHSAATAPVSEGRTTAVEAASCPFLEQSFAEDTIGMRLSRITVLRTGGRTTGCRLYALQDSSLAASEGLPGPTQPAVAITSTRYPSATAAHNAYVALGAKGTNPQQDSLGGGVTATCFQTVFYQQDHGADWACAFSKGSTAVLVRTVVTSPALDAVQLAKTILPAI
jgi:hypothetical protein